MKADETIEVPAPTAAPLVTAFGATCLVAGLVTSAFVSIVGAVLFVVGAVGWFREVLPVQHEEAVALEPPPPAIVPSPVGVAHLTTAGSPHRARLPVAVYPYAAGVRGGIAGGVAMAACAVLHGLIAHGSPWYTINLLAAAGSATMTDAPIETLRQFHSWAFVLAFAIHAVVSVLVGLLYGALLPMFPWHPAIACSLVAPLLWTGLLAATLHVVNPALNARIDWFWFVLSQIAFGAVAGFVVDRTSPVATYQHSSFAERAGLDGR